MKTFRTMRRFMPLTMLAGAISLAVSPGVLAQDDSDEELEEITVTGTRITNQNVIAASPVTTIGLEEIELKQTPNIERVFRDLPITIPGDGENVNNGTAGQATLDLRALGPERSIILIDGKRLAPYDINGIVTTDVIPVNMLQRVDVVTGGASAVYGSDAISGAVNFILRDDFQGFEIDLGYSDTEDGGDDSYNISALFGANFDDGRGNITIGGGRTERGAILLADRSFGLFGVASSTGSGLGSPPPEPTPDCSGNTGFTTAHSSGVGSTTAIPATLNLRSGNSYQFRDDGSLVQGECARFNFNPFNYYQTPQERWQATTIARYDVSDNVELYARMTQSANRSDFQIAPSGTFGTAFTIPVQNPFFNAGAQTTIVNDLNAGAVSFVAQTQQAITDCQANLGGTCDQATLDALTAALAADPMGFGAVGIQDIDGNGVFDASDAFTSTARRRTLELGPRSGIFDTDYTQYVLGARGTIPVGSGWNYDLSYQRGES
ncbi:MAG: TonB-dependent receptor plug domain-containing protein, partial [Woeseiaceae bacterium]